MARLRHLRGLQQRTVAEKCYDKILREYPHQTSSPLSTRILQGGGCKWWHFYPYEGTKELEAKFEEIMSGNANKNFLDKLISGAAVIKSNVLDKFLTFEKKFREDPAGELEIGSDHMN